MGQVALSKPQIYQAIENLMSRPDREVLEARPQALDVLLHMEADRWTAQAMAQEGWEATMCCAAEIFGKKLLLLNAVDIYDSSMRYCDTNRSLFLL